jgi:CMP-N-acetylneuraminic acid synthetase
VSKKKIKYLAIIPARANSLRIKNKNTIKFNKKKLFEYTYEAAKKVKKIDKIIFSTNDHTIINFCKNNNIDYLKRPENICRPNSKTEEAMIHTLLHFMKKLKFDVENVVLLQVTSPLRKSKDIIQCIKIFEKLNTKSIFSAYTKKLFAWSKTGSKINSLNYNFKNRKMSQKMSNLIIENGAIYITEAKSLLKKKNRLVEPLTYSLMKEEDSIDIDTKHDLSKLKLQTKF